MLTIKYSLFFILLNFCTLLQASEWQVNGLLIKQENNILVVNVSSLQLPFLSSYITDIKYSCRSSIQVYPIISCENGEILLSFDGEQLNFRISGWLDLSKNSWKMNIHNAKQSLRILLDSSRKNQLNIIANKLEISELYDLFGNYMFTEQPSLSANISTKIILDFNQNLIMSAEYQVDNFNWESDDGSYVFADAQLKGQFIYRQNTTNFELKLNSEITQGEALFKDIYLLFSDSPISFQSLLVFDNQFNFIKNQLLLNPTVDSSLSINLLNWQNDSYKINFSIKDLAKFKQKIMSSYFEILGLEDLDVIGELSGNLSIQDSIINSINLDVNDLNLEIASRKIEVQSLFAKLAWSDAGLMQASQMNWQSLLLAGMPISQSQLGFSSVADEITLNPESVIPIFDGSLIVHQLQLKDILKPQLQIEFDGEITPISLSMITEKMNWPIMNGSISGKIPGMKKVGQSISFAGSLDLNVFDGKMQINNLSMERLFGIAPVIAADINFQKLNLQQITSTFDFGEITGLVKGSINGLRITNWKADRLDAHIVSDETKNIKQTISQRAIDNISSIGGIQGALSRSFLRFFDSFKYKRIGFGCKLRNSICEMSGIQDGKNNYKLIEGKGIPSINIIGYQKFIDWQVFLDRLLNAGY